LDGNIMPDHGSLVLSDLATQYLTAVRKPCGRGGPLNVAHLLDRQGDDKLTGQMPTLANCDRARAFSLYDRCKPAMASVHEIAAPRV
jgi:hypothetical protein